MPPSSMSSWGRPSRSSAAWLRACVRTPPPTMASSAGSWRASRSTGGPDVKSVLVVGEINPDLILRGDRFPAAGKEVLVDDFVMTPGRASAICGMGLERLGEAVSFVGRVGADPWGGYCRAPRAGAGIDVSSIE